jgi:hypothetical protein
MGSKNSATHHPLPLAPPAPNWNKTDTSEELLHSADRAVFRLTLTLARPRIRL